MAWNRVTYEECIAPAEPGVISALGRKETYVPNGLDWGGIFLKICLHIIAICCALGCHLLTMGLFGAALGTLKLHLGPIWFVWRPPWVSLWPTLEATWAILETLGSILECIG